MITINKMTIKDAKRPLQLSITKRDIGIGDRKDPNTCAAARCLMRMEGVTEARVHKTRTYLLIRGTWWRYVTPLSLKIELVAFDRGGSFEPGDHFLLPVPENERPTGKRQGSGRDKRTGRARRSYHSITGVRAEAKGNA